MRFLLQRSEKKKKRKRLEEGMITCDKTGLNYVHKFDIEPLIFFVVYLEPSKVRENHRIRKLQGHVYFFSSTADLYRITLTYLPVS